jgi:hypothetical protein
MVRFCRWRRTRLLRRTGWHCCRRWPPPVLVAVVVVHCILVVVVVGAVLDWRMNTVVVTLKRPPGNRLQPQTEISFIDLLENHLSELYN